MTSRRRMQSLATVAGVLTLLSCLLFREGSGSAEGPSWWKGNTHTHTLNSDGDSPPGEVAHWYRDHGYDFLVLSDHNYYTVVDELQRELDREHERGREAERTKDPDRPRVPPRKLLLIPGEEVTDKFERAAIHVNGLGTLRRVGPQDGASKREVLQRDVDAIISAGGVPSVNHPNYVWSLDADDIAALKGLKHFEIYNGHPGVHNLGGGGRPSLEDMWDDLLSRGVRIFGVAVDDAHDFKAWGPRKSNPGRGWIVARAPVLTREAIREAFERGDFYASTGVVLADVGRAGDTVRVRIEPEEDTKFTTFFVGDRGRVLATGKGLAETYVITPGDRYVRVRVASSRAEYAWSQPFFRDSP